MSSSVFAIFNLENRLPRWQALMAIAAVLACALVPWLVRDASLRWQAVASIGSALVCLLGVRHEGWLGGACRPIRIAYGSGEDWHLTYPDGSCRTTSLHRNTRYFRHFAWLRFASGEALLLGPGDLPATSLRQLQVHLRQPQTTEALERVA